MNSIVKAAQDRFFSGQVWTYKYGGNGSFVFNWKDKFGREITGPGIDCSHLVQQTLLSSGYNLAGGYDGSGYITTKEMNDILHGKYSTNYDVVSEGVAALNTVQVGDIVIFTEHVGVITEFHYDPLTGVA